MNVEALTIQAPNSGRPRGELPLYALVAVFLFGAASVLYAAGSDALQLDVRLLTVSFLYVMGVSQAGVAFCAITRLVRAQWSKPYYRYAELATLAFAPFALVGFVLIYAYARGELLYWVSHGGDEHASPWLSERWLMGRGLIGLAIFYGVSLAYVWPSLRREPSPELERRLYLLSPWVLLAFVLCNTFFAWDFGMMLVPHWHSTVFPIHFWFGNLYAGAAALIAVPALLGGARFGALPIRSLGMLLTTFTLMWLYFFWAQYIVIWFGNLPHEFEPVWRQMSRSLRAVLLDDDDRLLLRAVRRVPVRGRQALARRDVRHRRERQRRRLAQQVFDRRACAGARRPAVRSLAGCERECGAARGISGGARPARAQDGRRAESVAATPSSPRVASTGPRPSRASSGRRPR